MVVKTHPVEVRIDSKGLVELAGMGRGETEARKLIQDLGIKGYHAVNFMHSVVRSDPMTAGEVAAVREKAAAAGLTVKDVADMEALHAKAASPAAGGGAGPGAGSTISALHEHSLTPSRKQKVVLPFVFLGVLAVLAAVVGVARDHMTRSYSQQASLAQVVARAGNPPPAAGGLAALVNPDDSRYVAVNVVSWPHWIGRNAIVENYYLRVPGLRQASIEDLVKGDRGAAPLTLRFDLSRTEGTRYHLDSILRDVQESGNDDLDVDVIPLALGASPPMTQERDGSGYLDASGFRADRGATWRGVERVALHAFVVRDGEGFRLRAENVAVALDPASLAPGPRALLEDLVVPEDQVQALAEGKLKAQDRLDLNRQRMTWYLRLQPAASPTGLVIGKASVDGVELRKLYVKNAA